MLNNRLERSLRATFIGMATNTVLAAGKLAAGILGHSHALVADAVESIADIFSSLIVWRGVVVAAEPADEDHPYGHGKAEPIASAVVALMLILAAAGIAFSSVREILSPHESPAPFTLAVLIAVLIIKETLFRFALREATDLESSAIRSDAWHHRSDAITSLAAGVGISISLWGGERFAAADDAAALAAAGIIAWNGWRLLRHASKELMDATPGPAVTLTERIRELALSLPDVDDVETCLVRKMGYHYFVDMHIEVDPGMTVARAHEVAHRVKDLVRADLPLVFDVLVHVEPRRDAEQR